jgi:hypothetical protein
VRTVALVGQCSLPARAWRRLGLAEVVEAGTPVDLCRVAKQMVNH